MRTKGGEKDSGSGIPRWNVQKDTGGDASIIGGIIGAYNLHKKIKL